MHFGTALVGCGVVADIVCLLYTVCSITRSEGSCSLHRYRCLKICDAAGDKARTSQFGVAASDPAKAPEGGSTAAAEPPRQDRKSGTQEAAAMLRRSPRLTPPKEAAADQQGLMAQPAVQAKARSRQAQQKPLHKQASGQQEGPQPPDKAPGKSSGARPLTKPRSPKLGTSTRRQLVAGLTGRSVAKQLDQASSSPSHFRTQAESSPDG